MRLIEEINHFGFKILFYDGIDFDMIFGHESEDILIFFVESWVEEAKRWSRECKIRSIFDGSDSKNLSIEDIVNPNVGIYQTSGNLDAIYSSVKEKILGKVHCHWGDVRGMA